MAFGAQRKESIKIVGNVIYILSENNSYILREQQFIPQNHVSSLQAILQLRACIIDSYIQSKFDKIVSISFYVE